MSAPTALELSWLQYNVTPAELSQLINHAPFLDAVVISSEKARAIASRRLGRKISPHSAEMNPNQNK